MEAAIIREAMTVPASSYLSVLRSCREVLEKDRRGEGELEVKGDLAYLPDKGKLVVIGDLHGDIDTLRWILRSSGALRNELAIMIFLGDYIDRGVYSPEVFYVVCKLKALYPGRVVLLRGNHEGLPEMEVYPHDTPYYLYSRFGEDWKPIYREMLAIFKRLSLAALLPGKYLMLHGGPPVDMRSIEDIAKATSLYPHKRFLEDILWSDPSPVEGYSPSPRGAGHYFGPDITARSLEIVDAKVLIRGHTPCDQGACPSQGGLTLTLFSRVGPPYYNLHAAYLIVNAAEPAKDSFKLAEMSRRLMYYER